jgi:hypothetical protein
MGVLNRLRNGRSAAAEESESTETEYDTERRELRSVTGEEYQIDPVNSVRKGGVEVKVDVPSDSPDRKYDKYAGARVREAIEDSYHNPLSPIWIGYEVSARQGFTCTGFPFKSMFQHVWLVGTTGAGKSVAEINMMTQLAYAGHGFVYFDPEAKDSRKLLKKLPEHRLDDVVWIEPGNPEFERNVSINFLEVPDCDTDLELDRAIKDRLQVLQAIFDNEDYWGVNMRTITNSIGRAMMEHNHECDDPSEYYTIIDFYFILLNGQRRQEFAETVDDPFLSFVHEIAEMDDDEVRPMLKRLIEWVQSITVRKIVACRESSIDFREILDEDKIVIVRTPTTDEDVKQMITLGTMRPIWNAVQHNLHHGTEHPYFAFFDESDKILSDRLQVDDMLARARGMKLSVTLSCQHPTQLDDSVLKDVKNLCNNPLYFKVPDDTDAKMLMKKFRGYSAIDLMEMDNHKVWTEVELANGEGSSDPHKLNTLAPMPDLRDDEAVDEAIRASLEEYGTDPITDAEIQDNLRFGDLSAALDGNLGTLDMETEYCRNKALKAIYDESVRQGDPGGFVALAACLPRLQQYLPEGEQLTDEDKAWRSVIQKLPDEYIGERENDEGDDEVKATDTSFMNVGESENDGNKEHWEQMAEAYVPMTQVGFRFDIPAQTGDAMPDAMARLDDRLDLDGINDADTYTDRVLSYRDEYPLLNRLAGANDAYIESEHSTGDTQPSQTVLNLVQAHNAEHRCLFVCREETAKNVYNTLAHAPAGCRSTHSKDDERRFYTGTDPLKIDGEGMTRPGTKDNVWVYDEQTGQYILRDTNDEVYARFDTAAEIFNNADAYPDDGDRTIMPPVIPEYELNGDSLSEVEWDIIVIPKPDTDDEGNKDLLTPSDLALYQEDAPNLSLIDLLKQLQDGTDDEDNDPSSPSSNGHSSSTDSEVADADSDEQRQETETDMSGEMAKMYD